MEKAVSMIYLDDIFDSRDLPALLEEAREDEDAETIEALEELIEELSSSPDFEYGITLIDDIAFEEYARQTAYDFGYVEDGSPMEMYVDWERWADDLKNGL